MIRFDPRARVMIAVEPADFRRGIDALARLCEDSLQANPRSGIVFVFRNRARTALKLLVYEAGGYWLCQRRLSRGSFDWWPRSGQPNAKQVSVAASDLTLLVGNGLPRATSTVEWKRISRRRQNAGAGDTEVDEYHGDEEGGDTRPRRHRDEGTRDGGAARAPRVG